MISDIEEGKINCVIIKDLSRFGRDYIDTGKYLERYFPENNVRFISIMDCIDSLKRDYDMLLPIKNIFNEQYARDISKKVHASIETKQRAGAFIGAFAPYGYKKSSVDKNKLVIDEYAAEVVRNIFKLYLGGYGKIRIAGFLNEKGIVCPSEYKKRNGDSYRNSNRLDKTSYWTYSTIHRILQSEMYIGNMVQGQKSQSMKGKPKVREKEDWIVIKGTHEAIIEKEIWNKVQDLLKRRTRNLDLHTNISMFAGFLKCGDCGRSFVKKGGTLTSEGIPRYYCGTYVRFGRAYCTSHSIPYFILEKILLDDLNIIIQNVADIDKIVKKNQGNQGTDRRKKLGMEQERGRLYIELEKVRKLKKGVYEDYKSELISKEEFVTYRQDYLKKEELLETQLESLERRQERERISDIFENPWIKRIVEMRRVEKLDRDIVMEMVREIKVYENCKIKIVYRFSGELEKLFKTVYNYK